MIALLTSSRCLDHDAGPRHPECPQRLRALLDHLRETGLADALDVRAAPEADRAALARVHDGAFLDALERAAPAQDLARIDADTVLGAQSLAAARCAAGAALAGVDLVLGGHCARAFCAVRPPGHHAEESTAMGFCFFNGIAVAAAHALAQGIQRVAVLDFDVHHGNGTVASFRDEERVLVCSAFQYPHYPYRMQEVRSPNIVNTPLPAGTGSAGFRRAVERDWLPALDAFAPQLILVSAGFDGHALDPLGDLLLDEDDFAWITRLIVAAARTHCGGAVVSVLEGGYHLGALARSAAAHIEELL